ncbi:hypothetical protein NHQ30_008436 [Ciborinia camelliae]|nr:hypothetical protein NHQ30_008436 [Ciborinia camelliae]
MSSRTRCVVQVDTVGVGCILWLPHYNNSERASRPYCQFHRGDHLLDVAGFNHPVVVLNIYDRYPQNPSIQFITLTSSYRPTCPFIEGRRTRATTSQPDRRYQLYLENYRHLPATSYFQIRHRFVLDLSRFYTYSRARGARACDYRLNRGSYRRLMERLHLHADSYHSTRDINNGLLRAASAAPQPLAQSTRQPPENINRFAALSQLGEDEHELVEDSDE